MILSTTTTLKDQSAVITGASSGIGNIIAQELAKQGVKLCLLGRQNETLESVARKAALETDVVNCYVIDLTSDEDIRRVTTRISQAFETIELLIHCAGTISLSRMESAEIQHFDEQYKVNVRAPYLLTQALLSKLKPNQGQIVFMNSSAGVNAKANNGQYAATKHALKALADSMRREVNADGIRVLSVFPGRTATPMQEAVFAEEGRPYVQEKLLQPEDVAAVVIHTLCLPRTAEVTDIHIRPMQKS